MEIPTRRRRALSTALALFLAIESVSAVAAVAVAAWRDADSRARRAAALAAADRTAGVVDAAPGARPRRSPSPPASGARSTRPDRRARRPARTTAPPPRPHAVSEGRARDLQAQSKSRRASGAVASGGSGSVKASARYKGRNHFWFPALGINRSVYALPVQPHVRPRQPRVPLGLRAAATTSTSWAMPGASFKPLHDAYVNGRLRVGMKAYYADGSGKVHTYKVKWWKLTRPTTSAELGLGVAERAVDDPPDVRRREQRVPADGPPGRGPLTGPPRRSARRPRAVESDDPQPQDPARDHEPLDLARPLPDLGELRVAQEALDLVLLDVAVAAVDLDRGVRRPAS